MSVAIGKVAYNLGTSPCSGTGLTWQERELDAAMSGPVAALLFDDEGMASIETILAKLADTEFAQEGLKRVLADTGHIEDWRVGEAIAETYLTPPPILLLPMARRPRRAKKWFQPSRR